MSTHNDHGVGRTPEILRGSILARGAFVLALGVAAEAPAQEFVPLGELEGGTFLSGAIDISADGTTVVGGSNSASGSEAFLWTEAGGMVGLGDLPGGLFTASAQGVSDDGTVVVGIGGGASGFEAFRWTEAGGMVGLGDLPGSLFNSSARGVSSDGTVVVGSGVGASGFEAFRWTEAGGMVGLGDLAGGSFVSSAYGVSGDGSVVVGIGTSGLGAEAFLWTEAGGMVGLGDLPGGFFDSRAWAISADGTVVVGQGNSASGTEAFRWTEAGGMVGLGDLAGGLFDSRAFDASGDGTVVVGQGISASGFEPFIWTEADGMQSVFQLLEDGGIDLAGWSNGVASGVSDDGSVIVGGAVSPEGRQAWIARLGEGGNGIVFPDDLMASARTLPEAARAMEFGGSSASAALLDLAINHGCGERMGAAAGRSYCIYGAGDGELLLDNPEDGAIGALSAGILFAGPDTLRFGGGPVVLGGSADLESDGESDFWGVGGGVFLGYGAYEAGPQFYASAAAYYIDADIERTYSNGNGRETSTGSPDGYGITAEARGGYRFPVGEGARVMPFAGFRVSYLSLDGYTESGGSFPAEFDDFDSTRTSVRLGVEGRFRAAENTDLIATGAWGTGLSASGDDASASIPDMIGFGAPGLDEEDDWVEGSIGALIASGRSQVSVSIGGRVGTNGDSGAIFSRLAVSW